MALLARDYQTEAVYSLWEYFKRASGNPLVCMPTGTGKSVVIAEFLHSVYKPFPNQRVMILTHVKELIEQNFKKLKAIWPNAPAGIYSAGLGRRDTRDRITFAGIASVAKRALEFGHIDIVIVDECHLISLAEETLYNIFFKALKAVNPHLKIIGFTATAWRAGVGHIEGAGVFTDTAFDVTTVDAFNRFIDEGYLLPLVPKPTNTLLDVSGVHMRGGEFIPGELQAAVNKEEVTRAALHEMIALGEDRKAWLLFCAGVEHAVDTAEMLTSLGVECKAVHSKLSTAERDKILGAYLNGDLKAVTNNNVLTTGFDHPMLDYIGMFRPTASAVLWVQMLGRGTRPVWPEADGSNWDLWGPNINPGKFDLTLTDHRLACIQHGPKQNCMVMDFANNIRRLGPVNDPVLPRKKGEKGGEAPVKLCNCCNTWNHAAAKICFFCKAPFTESVKIKTVASTEVLIKPSVEIVVDVFKVSHMTYELYHRAPKMPMVKVCYYSGIRKFNEYICLEHEGYALHRARSWWRQRTDVPVPETTLQALSSTSFLKVPTHIRVLMHTKYPEIKAYCFDGSCFGTQAADPDVAPIVETLMAQPAFSKSQSIQDEDIPF